MIENISQLKSERPDLVESFEKMDREQLLKQCYLECIDAINMEERVQVFMNECTLNLSKTTYAPSSIRSMINSKQEQDIIDFCQDLVCDEQTDEEIAKEVRDRASQYQ